VRNEVEIEEIFAGHGFEIIHPQQLSFADQIRIAHRAKVLAGFSGSQMLLSMFSEPDTQVVVIEPRKYKTIVDPNLILSCGISGALLNTIRFAGVSCDAGFYDADVAFLKNRIKAVL